MVSRLGKFTEAKSRLWVVRVGTMELLLNGAVSLRGDKKPLETVGTAASHGRCVSATELGSWNG